jgi:hypothetical protein
MITCTVVIWAKALCRGFYIPPHKWDSNEVNSHLHCRWLQPTEQIRNKQRALAKL